MHPILLKFGILEIRFYGAMVAAAFFTGFALMYQEAKRKNFYPDKILDMQVVMLVAGIIGARILHVLVNLDFYKDNPIDILFIWRGGLAFYGGMIFAILASWIFILKNKMPLWKTADLVAPYIALGHSIGRIGCYLNGCCFGKLAGDGVSRYPTQLYASFLLLLIFVILKLAEKKAPFGGFIFSLYLILYSAERFFLDFLRGDNPLCVLGLTVSQLISVFIFLLGLGVMLTKTVSQRWNS